MIMMIGCEKKIKKKCLKDSKINKDMFVRLICWICVWYSWIGICKLFF